MPPSATTSNKGGVVVRDERDRIGLWGGAELFRSEVGRKDWRMEDMEEGRGTAIVSEGN